MNLRPISPVFVMLVVLELFVVARARADHPFGTLFQVMGYVRDDSSNAVVGVTVVGDNYIGEFYPSVTDSNGYYVVSFPSEGNYRLAVDCASLTTHGYGCIGDIAVSPEGDPILHDFAVPKLNLTLQITNATLPHGNVGLAYHLQLGAIGGQAPFHWQLATNSPNLPAGLTFHSNGTISGTPTTFGAANLKLEVVDANTNLAAKTLALIINPKPVLSGASWVSNRFTMRLSGAPRQNYTVQFSTNVAAHWTTLLVTNNPDVGSFLVRDTSATNRQKFYRVLIGP